MLRIPSSDGVSVAVHELAGSEAPDHPIVLIAHATGFHGRAYLPVAERLAPTSTCSAWTLAGTATRS